MVTAPRGVTPLRPTRAQVAGADTWDLGDLFPTEDAWEAELGQIAADAAAVPAFAGRLHEGPSVLAECLGAYEKISIRLMRLVTYASLRFAGDGGSARNQALAARANALSASVAATTAFIRPELLALPEGTLDAWLRAHPDLHAYRRLLEETLRRRPHVLSTEGEALVAAFGEVLAAPYAIYSQTKSADVQFRSITDAERRRRPVSFALYQHQWEVSADAAVRRRAYRSYVQGLRGYRGAFAATLATEIKKNVILARVRRYPSAIAMCLDAHRTPVDVYHRVLDLLHDRLAPHMRRLARLRGRRLGLRILWPCDVKAPLEAGTEPRVSYEDARAMITSALEPLGVEYAAFIRQAFAGRWIDRADNVGKASGAFAQQAYGVHPYVLVTWIDTLRSAFVLAHELGHAGQARLAADHQRFFNCSPPAFFTEAPSTLNELLLGDHLLSTVGDVRVRRAVLAQLLATFQHNFVTHLLEARLERRLYDLAEGGEAITADRLSEETGALMAAFWGDTVKIDEGARLTWTRQPHYYFCLYPYTYAVGLTVATVVAARMRSEGAAAVDRWIRALKSGGTLEPPALLALAGADLSTDDPILGAVDYVGRLIDDLEQTFA